MKVTILSASTGNGHMSAAVALEAAFEAHGHTARVEDVLDHTGAGFRSWYRGGYETLVKRKPEVWGHLYRASDRPLAAYQVQTALDLFFVRRMERVLRSQAPDWVLCTHSLPQPSLARWRRRWPLRFAIVVTDLYPQRMWLRGRPDFAFVPTAWTEKLLVERAPHLAGKTEVVGIPVHPSFGPSTNRSEAKVAMGLNPGRPAILLTAGGIGGGPLAGALKGLEAAGVEADVLAICGRSVQSLNMAKGAAEQAVRVRIVPRGHVSLETMAAAMKACDVIVAKPGGITTFEAMASHLPFVIYRPFLIPGQEEKNAEFLTENGIGVDSATPGELGACVRDLLLQPNVRALMAEAAARFARPDSATAVVRRCETVLAAADVVPGLG